MPKKSDFKFSEEEIIDAAFKAGNMPSFVKEFSCFYEAARRRGMLEKIKPLILSARDLSENRFWDAVKEIHGDRYEYPNGYPENGQMIDILCKDHGLFQQSLGNHKSGSGCKKCSEEAKVYSFETFLEKAVNIFGDRYVFIKEEWRGTKKDSFLICEKHGKVSFNPYNLLNRHSACGGCGRDQGYETRSFSKEEIIQTAISVGDLTEFTQKHGGMYNNALRRGFLDEIKSLIETHAERVERDFFETVDKVHAGKGYTYPDGYDRSNTHIRVNCHSHGIFVQNKSNHKNGCGCPDCDKEDVISFEEWVGRSNEKHGVGTYEYHKVFWSGYLKKTWITCKKHGFFEQLPHVHCGKNFQGCPDCGIERRALAQSYTFKKFVEIAIDKYGDKTIFHPPYNGSKKKMKMECREFGHIYHQIPNSHLCGRGCPECSEYQRTSKGEKEVYAFVAQIVPDAINNDKEILDGKEIDILIPSLKIGIEFNGVYYHAIDGKNKRIKKESHFDKREMANDIGYRLVTIWEDDWRDRNLDEKEKLVKILTNAEVFDFSRSEIVVDLDYVDVNQFINNGYKLIDIDIEEQKRDKYTVFNSGVAHLVRQ